MTRRLSRTALALLLLAGSGRAAAGGFFDDVPRKGYVRDDVSLDVLATGDRETVVARIRYIRLALDPGRRDIAWDAWPEREMLMVERGTGERLIFEKLSRLAPPADPSARQPRGRIALEGGMAVETFFRAAPGGAPGSGGGPSACAALDALVLAGGREIPVATSDLDAPTVRLGIGQLLESLLPPRDREVVDETVPILYRARSQGIPISPLVVLDHLYPGRTFAPVGTNLTFRTSAAAPLNPADGAWRTLTEAPEMLPGAPLF